MELEIDAAVLLRDIIGNQSADASFTLLSTCLLWIWLLEGCWDPNIDAALSDGFMIVSICTWSFKYWLLKILTEQLGIFSFLCPSLDGNWDSIGDGIS